MNIDTVKAQENLDEPEKAFELDNVAVRLVRSREPLVSDEPFSNPDSVVRALSEQMRDFDREVLGIINLDSRMRLINVSCICRSCEWYIVTPKRDIKSCNIIQCGKHDAHTQSSKRISHTKQDGCADDRPHDSAVRHG